MIAEERRSNMTYSLVRLSIPQKAPLVSSIVPEMSLWSSSLWRMREKEGDENDGRRKRGTVSATTEALHSPNRRGWSGSHGLPHGHYSLHHPPLLHLALRAALPTKSIPLQYAHMFLGKPSTGKHGYICTKHGWSDGTQHV